MNYKIGKCLILLIICLAVFLGPVRYTSGDPQYTLLTSEAILHEGTIHLDSYCKNTSVCAHSRIHAYNEHYFYFLPLGAALVSVPVVAVFNAFNLPMLKYDAYAQRTMGCIALIISFFLMLKIANIFLSRLQSLAISTTFIFGTSLISTIAAALWSHDFAVVFAFLCIYLVFRYRHCYNQFSIFFIALSVFMAYLCRPTLFIFAPCIFLFLIAQSRKHAFTFLLYLIACMITFILFSFYQYSQILPPYYLAADTKFNNFFTGIIGILFSPSRGLFIFSPFLLCLILFGFKQKNITGTSYLFIAAIWPVLHCFLIASRADWWGGYSFGPRYMTDCIPGLFLLSVSCWPTIKSSATYRFILIVTIMFSIFVHTWQGRFNIDAAIGWNQQYDIAGHHSETVKHIFDWSIAQCIYPKN